MPDLTLVPDPDYKDALVEQLTRAVVVNLKAAVRAASDGALDTASMAIEEARRLCACAMCTKGFKA